MRTLFLLGLFSLFQTVLLAQNLYLDSLRVELQNFEQQENFEADTNYINTLNDFAYELWTNSPDSTIILSQKAIELSEAASFPYGKISAMINLGTGLYQHGKYLEAIEVENRAIALAKETGDKDGLAALHSNIMSSYLYLGMYSEAISHTYASLELYKKMDDKWGIGRNTENLGRIYFYQGKYDSALAYYQRSLEIYKELDDPNILFYVLSNIGGAYHQIGNFDKAKEYYLSSLKLSREINQKSIESFTLSSLGRLYGDDRFTEEYDIQKAISLVNEALEIERTLKDPSRIVDLNNELSYYFQVRAKPDSALIHSRRALKIADEIGNVWQLKESHENLYYTFKEIGKSDSALHHFENFKIYSDSIASSETQEELVRLEEEQKYKLRELALKNEQEKETARQQFWIYFSLFGLASIAIILGIVIQSNRKKQRINQLLTESKAQLDKQNKELQEMNVIKNRLLSIIGHDVKGPLTSLKGLLYLSETDAISKSEYNSLAKQTDEKIDHVIDFINNLLHWAKTQMDEAKANKELFNIKPPVEETLELLRPQAQQKGIELRNHLEEETSVFADIEMIKIVVRNISSNAIKFCSEGDSVSIRSQRKRDSNELLISISDTGVGMSQDKIDSLFKQSAKSESGTNNEAGTGLGLMLSKQYIELNDGTIWVESEEGKGSTFWISLPLSDTDKTSA